MSSIGLSGSLRGSGLGDGLNWVWRIWLWRGFGIPIWKGFGVCCHLLGRRER